MSASTPSTSTGTVPKPADAADATTTAAIAAQVMGLLDQIENLIPGFLPYDTNDAKRVAAAARFARDLVPPTVTAVTSFTPAAGIFDSEGGKAALEFGDVMGPVAQRMSALLDGFEFTVDNQLAKAGAQALSAYAWAQKHARNPEGVALRPYVDEMEKRVRKTLNRRKPAVAATTPPVTPTPVPPGAKTFLAPNLVPANPVADDNDDLPDDFRKALEEVTKN